MEPHVPIIPSIDLSPLLDGSDEGVHNVAQQFLKMTHIGFCYVTNHNIPLEIVEDVFQMNRNLHALPIEEKLAMEINKNHRGYIKNKQSTLYTSTVDVVKKPNQNESFLIVNEVSEDDIKQGLPLAGPNQWPNIPGFREKVDTFRKAMYAMARKVVQALSVSLGLPREYLDEHFVKSTNFTRLLKYPTVPEPVEPDVFGAAPHTDYGFMTFVIQEEVGGLQVKSKEGAWIDVPPKPGHFVLNVGDILERWSNGIYPATPHRVLPMLKKERYVVVYFFDPFITTKVSPLPQCISEERPKKYEEVIYIDYMMHRLTTNYAHYGKQQNKI
jgi:isopenicillin N synthase-like dioxygenase